MSCGKRKKKALSVASTGIAATLLPTYRIIHVAFKVPLNLLSNDKSFYNIFNISFLALIFIKCSLIVWDEVIMPRAILVIWCGVWLQCIYLISDKYYQWYSVKQKRMNWKHEWNILVPKCSTHYWNLAVSYEKSVEMDSKWLFPGYRLIF